MNQVHAHCIKIVLIPLGLTCATVNQASLPVVRIVLVRIFNPLVTYSFGGSLLLFALFYSFVQLPDFERNTLLRLEYLHNVRNHAIVVVGMYC